jgi:hypothetical protein
VSDLELLARLAAIEARLEEIEAIPGIEATLAVPHLRLYGAERGDCGCRPTTLCANSACPRRWTVISNTGGT